MRSKIKYNIKSNIIYNMFNQDSFDKTCTMYNVCDETQAVCYKYMIKMFFRGLYYAA